MKNKLLLFLLLTGLQATAQIRYEYKTYCSSAVPMMTTPDVIIDNYSTPQVVGMMDIYNGTDNGILLLRYNTVNGSSLTATEFYVAGKTIRPVRLTTFQGFTYIIGYTILPNTDKRFVFIKVNSSTNVVSFCRYFDAAGSGYNTIPKDIVYAGGGIFYVAGSYEYSSNSAIFVAKLTFTGALIDFKTSHINFYDAKVCAMQFYSSSALYISGVATKLPVITVDSTYAFITVYNPSTATATTQVYGFFPFATGEKLSVFKAQRIGSEIYAAGETFIPFAGNAPARLIIARFDATSMSPLASSIYSAGIFRWCSRLNVVNGLITLSGYTDAMDTSIPGYATVYFDKNTTAWTAGSHYPMMASYAEIETVMDAAGYAYSLAARVSFGDTLYRIKAMPLTGTTSCETAFGFFYLGTGMTQISTSTMTIGYTYLFPDLGLPVPAAVPVSNNTICYFDPYAQRTSNSEEQELNAWPNPVTSELNISSGKNPDEPLHVEITDVTGKIVYSSQLSGMSQYTISLSGHPQGVYLLRVWTQMTEPETIRILKE